MRGAPKERMIRMGEIGRRALEVCCLRGMQVGFWGEGHGGGKGREGEGRGGGRRER